VRFENVTPENLKVAPLSDRAFRLWFGAVCYCSRAQSDGRVPAVAITNLSVTANKCAVEELVRAGLVQRLDEATYLVHDYLDYNPSRERLAGVRESNRDRVARWRAEHARNGVTDTDVTHYSNSTLPGGTGMVVKPLVVDVVNDHDKGDPDSARERSRRAAQDQPPSSMPPSLLDVLAPTLDVLAAVQSERGGQVPTVRGVGLALARFPDRDHLAVVRELEHWALAGAGQARPVRDWARTLATFLERSPAASAVRVASNGHRAEGPVSPLLRKLRETEAARNG
jgi:hypothetical protein